MKQPTTVRISVSQDLVVHATKSGLKLGNNTITWSWLESAKAQFYPPAEVPKDPPLKAA